MPHATRHDACWHYLKSLGNFSFLPQIITILLFDNHFTTESRIYRLMVSKSKSQLLSLFHLLSSFHFSFGNTFTVFFCFSKVFKYQIFKNLYVWKSNNILKKKIDSRSLNPKSWKVLRNITLLNISYRPLLTSKRSLSMMWLNTLMVNFINSYVYCLIL